MTGGHAHGRRTTTTTLSQLTGQMASALRLALARWLSASLASQGSEARSLERVAVRVYVFAMLCASRIIEVVLFALNLALAMAFEAPNASGCLFRLEEPNDLVVDLFLIHDGSGALVVRIRIRNTEI